MSHRFLIVLLGFLIGIQPVTTDLYLPILPELTIQLGGSIAQAQMTLSALLLAFGCSQLLWGLLSDRYGRRPILLFGLLLFAASGLMALWVKSMPMLIWVRVFQGVGMGAVVVCGRAIVRDQFTPLEGAKAMSKAFSILGLIACLCVPLGVLIRTQTSAISVFAALGLYGLVLGWVVWLYFKESLPPQYRSRISLGGTFQTWAKILKSPSFRTYCALSTASYGGLFVFLASSSFVFTRWLDLSIPTYGLIMMSISAVYFFATSFCRYLLRRLGWKTTVAVGALFSLSGSASLLVLAYLGVHSVWAVVLPFAVFMLGHGVHQPCGQSGSVASFPQAAGAAASLNGFFMMVFAFLAGIWLGQNMAVPSIFPLAHGLFFWSLIIGLVAWLGVQKHDIKQ
jgi:MFS transporter, DHA1 family, multidrug resistance protein